MALTITSAVVPGLTTSIDDRVVTVAIALSAGAKLKRKFCIWSAETGKFRPSSSFESPL